MHLSNEMMNSTLITAIAAINVITAITVIYEYLKTPILQKCRYCGNLKTMRDYYANELGETVRQHRKKLSLSQQEFAKIAGIGKTSVFDIEKGKPTVRLATLLAALRALNLTITISDLPPEQPAVTPNNREDWKIW